MTQPLPFSEQLKRERQLRGWSQRKLASQIGCDLKTIRRWESGETLPQAYYRPRIFELFEKNAEELGLLEPKASSSFNVSTEAASSPMPEATLLSQEREAQVDSSSSSPPIQETDLSSQQTSNESSPAPVTPSMQEATVPTQGADSEAAASSSTSSLQEIPASSQETGGEPFSSPGTSYEQKTPLSLPSEVLIRPLVYDIHPSWVVALAWEPCGTRIASAGGDGTVHVWDTNTGQHLHIYRGHEHKRNGILAKTAFLPTVYTARWSPLTREAPRIASAGDGKAVHIWNPDTGATILKYTGHSGLLPNVYAVDWSPDGTRIASACSSIGIDKTVHIWDVKTGETILRYNTPCGLMPNFSVLALDWSPDGTRIASTCSDGKVHIWNATTEEIVTYSTPSDWVCDVAWSPDSRWLAVANGDHTIQIWDTLTRRMISTYSGHTDSIRNIAWSPNGLYLASASNDNTVRVWNVTTGDTLTTYRGHTHWATAVVWSPDGTRIASASNDKTVQIWWPPVSAAEPSVRAF
jgi:WD40 repeat protein/transcriptional regulator with XRE-family HTH domain